MLRLKTLKVGEPPVRSAGIGKLLERSTITKDERVHIWNVDNGERLVTYAIRAERLGDIISLNGWAAREKDAGERIVLASCARSGDLNVHHETRAVILDELATSLERGHWRVALRRFLMLRARDFDIPDSYKTRCEALMSACPARDLRRIQDQVQSWVDMLTPSLSTRFEPLTVRVDTFGYLHSVSCRRQPSS
jgi:aspartate 1-decarboxylase